MLSFSGKSSPNSNTIGCFLSSLVHIFKHITTYISNITILLAASNEAKAKTSDKSRDIVAQLPLGRHEEGVKEGPRAIPALVVMMMMMMILTLMVVVVAVVVSSFCL